MSLPRIGRGVSIGGVFLVAFFLTAVHGIGAPIGVQKGREPKIPERYREAWDANKGQLDLERIARSVAELRSEDTAARRVAFAGLKEETGLERIYQHPTFDPDKRPAAQGLALRDWEDYARNLGFVLKEWVRILMDRGEDEAVRAPKAFRLGLGAPHRAFVPLLREIIANPEETPHMRYRALRGLALIPHDGLIEYLLSQIDPEDAAWSVNAWDLINRLTAGTLPRDLVPRLNEDGTWQRFKARFLHWWEVNKKDFKYDRRGLMSM